MPRLFLFTIILALCACEKSNDDDLVLAYAELRLAKSEERIEILQDYGLSVDDFEQKIDKIKKEPERWLEFQNKLIKALDSIANELESEDED